MSIKVWDSLDAYFGILLARKGKGWQFQFSFGRKHITIGMGLNK